MYKTECFTPARFTAKASIKLRGAEIPYETVCEDNLFYNNEGKPIASIFSYSYFRSDVPDSAGRPVLFGFNGGPGSSSMMVHSGFLGAKRIAYGEDPDNPPTLPPYGAVDNPQCLLDVADVVLVDPVGTGFGLLLDDACADRFYSIEADAEALLVFIQGWLSRYRRWASPKYLVGESYGCTRAAVAAGIAGGGSPNRSYNMAFDGLVFIGSSVSPGKYFNREMQVELSVLALPTCAAINWYHNRPCDQSLEAFVEEAARFADGEYLLALHRGSDLPDEQCAAVRDKLVYYTGISAGYLDEHQLRFDEQGAIEQILKPKGLQFSRYDGRITLPRFDSRMGSNFTTVKDDPAMAKYGPYFHSVLNGVMFPALNIQFDRVFVSHLDTQGDKFLRRTDDRGSSEQLSSAMRRCPGMRTFFANGYYDLCTQLGVARYTIAHAGLPRDRTFLKAYPSGHMLYIGEENIQSLTDDIRTFLAGGNPAQ